jgi:hypothetical protein
VWFVVSFRGHPPKPQRLLLWVAGAGPAGSRHGGGETHVVAAEVVDGSLGQHRHVLELRLAQGRRVGGNDDELGLAVAEVLHRRAVAERHLARAHDQGQLLGEGVGVLLLLLLRGHCVGWGGGCRREGWDAIDEKGEAKEVGAAGS